MVVVVVVVIMVKSRFVATMARASLPSRYLSVCVCVRRIAHHTTVVQNSNSNGGAGWVAVLATTNLCGGACEMSCLAGRPAAHHMCGASEMVRAQDQGMPGTRQRARLGWDRMLRHEEDSLMGWWWCPGEIQTAAEHAAKVKRHLSSNSR